MRRLTVVLALVFVATACPTRDKEPSGNGGGAGALVAAAGNGGAGASGIGGAVGGTAGISPPPNTVTITAPTTTVYTNATVSLSIMTGQPTNAAVTLVASGPTGLVTLGTITAPQSSFVWNTTGAAEGMYSIQAQLATNGTTTMSNAVSVVVDRTPPQVLVPTLVPAIGASNVVLQAPIQASFSEPVLPTTVSPAAIPIQTASGVAVPTTVTLSADGKMATAQITPSHGKLSLGQDFTGSFTNAITDLAGNTLVPLSAPWEWNVPAWIPYAPISSTMNATLQLVVGSNFQPVVAYNVCGVGSGGGCNPLLHVAVSDGEAWNDLGQVAAGVSASQCALFLDDKNNPTVAWPEGSSSGSGGAQVTFSTWNGAAWVTTVYPPISLTAAEAVDVDAIAVVGDSMGRPMIAYRGDLYAPSISTNVFVSVWTGTAWDSSYGAVNDNHSATFDVVINASGVPVVTVVDSDGTSGAYEWQGTSWSFTGGSSASNASATTDAGGHPVMLTSSSSSWVPVHLSGVTWLPLVSTGVARSPGSDYPNLTSDLTHEPVVGWYSPGTSPPGIGLARWTGSAWDNRPGFATAGATPAAQVPALTVDPRNNMWIGWNEGTTVNIWMSNY